MSFASRLRARLRPPDAGALPTTEARDPDPEAAAVASEVPAPAEEAPRAEAPGPAPVIDETFPADDVARYYDEWNERYEAVFGDVYQHLKATDHDELLDHMIEVAGVSDGERLLDAGCGIAGPARHFAARRRVHIDAVTVSAAQAERARELVSEQGFDDRISVHVGDFHHLEDAVEGGTYDLVYFLESLVHAADPAQVLRSAFAVLRPGGRLYVKDFYRGRSDDPAAQRTIDECVEATNRICHLTIRNTEDVLGWIEAAGFEIALSQALAVPAYSIADGHEFCSRYDLDVAAGRDHTTTYYLDNLEIVARKPARHDEGRAAGAASEPAIEVVAAPPVVGVRSADIAGRLARDGYVRLGPCLDAAEVRAAAEVFDEAMRTADRPVGDEWFPTGLLPDPEVRSLITERLTEIVAPHLASIFEPDVLEVVRLDFSVKPSSPASELGPHQDYSLVDERVAQSLYLWIPLVDTDEVNGALHVVPGSHRFANRIRSRHVPAVFDEVLDLVGGSSTRIECQAGELVLMVSGVVHHSPPNRSGSLRLAVHGIVKPTAEPLLFYYADADTPADVVECYEVDIEGYLRATQEGRPAGRTPDRLEARPPSSMAADRYRSGLAAVRDAR
ncbi:phytanoyl-CoA dioxygenase family protein [Aquihabitans sp. G128]|uniref:phytanoyl-CoA dioxygenase family protein n=1 Tax=Aquihabitans sp. G128 TaxID=2849779 RepID=UPI001C23CF26|nr:phytanoyl-CoA dioxygenase family protein [Aquihabitans sp. G128]QXC60296.1 phytanoyl-CoA dioxygenase family protein [Aquihabitans sp. G128]